MLGIQVSIGALNDLADERLDALAKPRKPIPAGLVSRRVARAVAIGGAGIGITLSLAFSIGTASVGLACLALGWVYDLRLSRTPISWLPLALALPLLPIHAWLGTTGSVPPGLLALVPVGVLGGGGLAIANGLVDLERDASAGRASIVVLLGRRRAWLAQVLLLAAAASLAVAFAPDPGITGAAGGPGGQAGFGAILGIVRGWGVWLGVGGIGAGAGLLGAGRPSIRERGWELEAIGVAWLGVAWLAGTAASIAFGNG